MLAPVAWRDAVASVHPDHRVSPTEGGRKAAEVRIFHVPESSFDMVLTTVAEDDLRVRELRVGGEENAFTQNPLPQLHTGQQHTRRISSTSTASCSERTTKWISSDCTSRTTGARPGWSPAWRWSFLGARAGRSRKSTSTIPTETSWGTR